jgi:HlyD family secretion protein
MKKVVFVVQDGVAKIRAVETGLASDTEIEIVTGLAAGEKIVEGPYRILSREISDGKRVAEQTDGKGQKNGGGKAETAEKKG